MKLDPRTSFIAAAGILAFLLINLLLRGRTPDILNLGLGLWVMQLIYYQLFEKSKATSFGRYALTRGLLIAAFAPVYWLISRAWH
jgi:hypothetical protein